MYRPRSVDSPTSRRRRRRNPRIDGERGGETRVAQKFAFPLDGRKGNGQGPSAV
jgi:hypothetical protein